MKIEGKFHLFSPVDLSEEWLHFYGPFTNIACDVEHVCQQMLCPGGCPEVVARLIVLLITL